MWMGPNKNRYQSRDYVVWGIRRKLSFRLGWHTIMSKSACKVFIITVGPIVECMQL
jgi:hypothetical protein